MPSKCPIKRREQRKRWRLANPDKVHKSSQDWNARNLENKRAGSRAWANANPERSGAWIKAHPEYYQQYRKLHPDKVKANTHNRRARKRGNGGTFTAAQWVALQVLHGCRCRNNRNKGKPKTNTSGFLNVSKSRKRWRAYYKLNNKFHSLGTYDTPEEAYVVAEAKRKELLNATA